MTKISAGFGIAVAVSLALITSPGTGADDAATYLYLFSAHGDFLKFAVPGDKPLENGRVAEIARGLAGSPTDARATFVCCYDGGSRHIFAVGPTQGPSAGNQSDPYRVLALDVPTLRPTASIELLKKPVKSPSMLLSPQSRQLLLSYEIGGSSSQWQFMKEVFDPTSLQRLSSAMTQVPRTPYDPEALARARFTRAAHIAPDGATIIDRPFGVVEGGEYEVSNGQVRFRPARPWPAPVEQYRTARNVVLRRLGEGDDHILAWEVTEDGSRSTGRFASYDRQAAPALREFVLPELAGPDPRFVAASPDLRYVYFVSGGTLFSIDTAEPARTLKLEVSGLSAEHLQPVFADR